MDIFIPFKYHLDSLLGYWEGNGSILIVNLGNSSHASLHLLQIRKPRILSSTQTCPCPRSVSSSPAWGGDGDGDSRRKHASPHDLECILQRSTQCLTCFRHLKLPFLCLIKAFLCPSSLSPFPPSHYLPSQQTNCAFKGWIIDSHSSELPKG